VLLATGWKFAAEARYRPRVDYPKFSVAKLGDLTDYCYLAASCSKCQHGVRLSVARLTAKLGPEFAVEDILKRLRCERCGSKQATLTYLNPSQRTGNLHQLFGQPSADAQ
jgi:hypothetical protein